MNVIKSVRPAITHTIELSSDEVCVLAVLLGNTVGAEGYAMYGRLCDLTKADGLDLAAAEAYVNDRVGGAPDTGEIIKRARR